MSPVRSRGANQDMPIPYITPSLRDYPVADDSLVRESTTESNFGSPVTPTQPAAPRSPGRRSTTTRSKAPEG